MTMILNYLIMMLSEELAGLVKFLQLKGVHGNIIKASLWAVTR